MVLGFSLHKIYSVYILDIVVVLNDNEIDLDIIRFEDQIKSKNISKKINVFSAKVR